MRFHVPTQIYFGSGIIDLIEEIVRNRMDSKRPFLVTDKSIIEIGLTDRVFSHFPEIPYFAEVEPNPRHTTVNQAGEMIRRERSDLIIAVGGGSVMDAGKAAALLATNSGGIEDYEGREKYQVPPLPVVAVPTTCGTGSEVTWVSVITHTERKFKMSIKGPLMFPAAALVDPDFLLSLPKALIASTGMDALTHAVEAYTVKPATFMTDIFACEAAKLIFTYLRPAFQDIRQNSEARERIMRGSLLAGIAFGNSDVGAVHCIAESIGSIFDTPHGVANAVFLPFVMSYNLPDAAQRYAELAGYAGIKGSDAMSTALSFIEEIKELSRSLNIPSFRDLGIGEEAFPEIAKKSFHNNSNHSNIPELTEDDYLKILHLAL
jgi:alcohol dehydrogenase